MTVVDLYLEEMRQHWWLHFLAEGSVHFWVFIILLWSVLAILKARKLKRIGECVQGVVVDRYAQEDNGTTRYIIKYIFVPESKKQSNTLVHGYCKHESGALLPTAVLAMIASFHGSRHFGTGCIVQEKTISKQHYASVEIGDSIDIVFNPKHPKMIQIPKMSMDSSHARKVALCICSTVSTVLLLVYYCAVVMFADTNSTQWYILALNGVLLFLSYSASIGLVVASCYCCYIRYQKTHDKLLNSSLMQAKYERVVLANAATTAAETEPYSSTQDPLLSISITP